MTTETMNSQNETTSYRVYVAGWATEHEVQATSQEAALEIAERDYADLYDIDEIGVG